jgi:hypothetical protein
MKCGTAGFSYFVKAHISATTNGYQNINRYQWFQFSVQVTSKMKFLI